MEYNHNHPTQAAHVLSFRDVTNETKKELVHLFEMGHNASSARHTYVQELLLHQGSDTGIQTMLADRAFGEKELMEMIMVRVSLKSCRKI